MARTISIRKALGTLVLGSALALPGLQLAQSVAPSVTHAAAIQQVGPVLAGTWLNLTPGVRFSELLISASTTSRIGESTPFAVNYGVNVFSIPAHRFVAFGSAAPVPFNAANRAVVTLTPLSPVPVRLRTVTTLTLSLIDNGLSAQPTLRVAIHDHSLLLGDRFSVEIMHR